MSSPNKRLKIDQSPDVGRINANCIDGGNINRNNTVSNKFQENLSDVMEYLELSQEQLIEVIKSDGLKVPREIVVFNAVLAWVKHKIEARRQYLASLMEYVRFPLMSSEELIKQVEQEPLFISNTQCCSYIIEAMGYHLMKGTDKSTFSSPRTKPRILTNSSKKMLVVVGQNNSELSMEKYDFEEQKWLQGPETFNKKWRNGSKLLNTGEKVYMIGGSGNEISKVDVFDLKLEKWSECSDLLEGRAWSAVAILDGDIYVSGGLRMSYLKSCVKLDKQTGSWIRIADMIEERGYHGMCSMDGKIYAVGGSNRNNHWLSSLECYSPETNSWTRLPSMSIRRSNSGLAAADGKLYVVGGWEGRGQLVEVFNSVDQKWTKLADLNVARRNSSAVAANGLIYVVGGSNNTDRHLDSVEVYDPRINTWTMLPNKMNKSIKHVSASVIDWPPQKM